MKKALHQPVVLVKAIAVKETTPSILLSVGALLALYLLAIV